jgi:hypothetical protein
MRSEQSGTINIWSRLGISVVFAALFSIILTEFCQQRTFYQVARWYGCFIFTMVGIVFGIIGLQRKRQLQKHAEQGQTNQHETAEPSESSGQWAYFLFWGPVLLTFGAIIFFVPYKPKEKAAIPVQARTAVRPRQTSAPPAVVVTAPVPSEVVTNTPLHFPEVKIQGVVFRPPKNAVIVGGHTYFAGDVIENAKVFAINAEAVVLELKGHYKVIPLDRPSLQLRREGSGGGATH